MKKLIKEKTLLLKEIIKNNKKSFYLLSCFLLILIYCHFQTMILNDDLPYSLFFRAGRRITNIKEVISNQIFDYSHINARIFLHAIVQFLLIFDKNLWSILNPIVIILCIMCMTYFIKTISKTKINNVYLIIGSIISFLIMYNYKYLVYWVAGSVNYVFVFLIMICFIIYYLKYGLTSKYKLTLFLCFILSMICEALAIFTIILVITDYILKKVILKEKNITVKYIALLVFSLIGFMFIYLAPSTQGRMSSGVNPLLAIGIISKNLFSLDLYNLFPVFLILSIGYFTKDDKLFKPYLIIIIFLYLFALTKNNYIYLIIGIVLFLYQSYIFYKNKDYNLIPILICAYALSYSLIITNEFEAGRLNFHFDLIIACFTMYNLFYQKENINLLKYVLIILFIFSISFEVYGYSYVGYVKRQRDISIRNVQSGKSKVLETKIIKAPFDRFHVDANNPLDKDYWAYAAFKDYYNLPDDIKIKSIE